MPVRPFSLARNLLHTGPGKTVAADADAVADRATAAEHVVKVGMGRIDDQRARRLLGWERNLLPAQIRRKLHRSDFRLFLRRQRRQRYRSAVGPDGRLQRTGWRTNCLRRTQAAVVIVGIDALRRTARTIGVD